MNFREQSPVLTSPEEIKDVMKQIGNFQKNLEYSLASVEKGKESDAMVNAKDYIERIINVCKVNNQGDDFGEHLSELAEAYESLKDQLFQLDPDTLKSQLSKMEKGTAIEGLNDFINKN